MSKPEVKKKMIIHYEMDCPRCKQITLTKGSINDYNNAYMCPCCGSPQARPNIVETEEILIHDEK